MKRTVNFLINRVSDEAKSLVEESLKNNGFCNAVMFDFVIMCDDATDCYYGCRVEIWPNFNPDIKYTDNQLDEMIEEFISIGYACEKNDFKELGVKFPEFYPMERLKSFSHNYNFVRPVPCKIVGIYKTDVENILIGEITIDIIYGTPHQLSILTFEDVKKLSDYELYTANSALFWAATAKDASNFWFIKFSKFAKLCMKEIEERFGKDRNVITEKVFPNKEVNPKYDSYSKILRLRDVAFKTLSDKDLVYINKTVLMHEAASYYKEQNLGDVPEYFNWITDEIIERFAK